MNDALRKGAWYKGCTDIMYQTIEYMITPETVKYNVEILVTF